LGVIACEAKHVTDAMFFTAAKALANEVTAEDFAVGRIFPPLSKMRHVSGIIATEVAKVAYEQKLARKKRPADLLKFIKSLMYEPTYPAYI
jgi:malate dehydrogenase (oxaloacetate-decarboxylating)(NADP+)